MRLRGTSVKPLVSNDLAPKRSTRKRKLLNSEEDQSSSSSTMDAAVMTCASKRRKGKQGKVIPVPEEVSNGITSLPAEVLETIFSFLDPVTLLKSCTLTCKQWTTVIKQAPWDKLPKFLYKEITVTGQNGFEVKLERNVHSDNSPPPGEEGSNKPRKLKKSIRRERPSLDRVAKYMKHISCKKLIFQSLCGVDFSKMLRDFSRFCLDTKILAFDFCNFASIRPDLVVKFLKTRQDTLMEISLSSCRNLDICLSQEQFLEAVGELRGPLVTYRLKDHYASSPWKDRLAEIILDSRPFWIMDLDGISPSMVSVENRLKRWLRPLEAREETGGTPLDVVSPVNPVAPKRKPIVIKFENSRSTRLFSFWKKAVEIMPYPTEGLPNGTSGSGTAVPLPEPRPLANGRTYWKKPPKICKILETCFDGQRRYSAHRSRVVIEDLDGTRFSVCLQR